MSKKRAKSSSAADEQSSRRLHILPTENPDDETCMSFSFDDEDHTLGNALRYVMTKNPQTTFVGYTVPHPFERKISVRIQTNDTPAIDVLAKGLRDLEEASQHVLDTFEKSLDRFRSMQPDTGYMDTE
ncbi:DNA-directed RNA polymerases I and III subunit RPAC2-like [Oscarella lobularis]|uniref:DNA-directed RNA polymerases I and III subunit RPAC2-like n=1 Tax=Oscarella lobularis TaxID=121494 RepID=UPI003313A15E